MRFQTTIQLTGKNTTGILVPDEVVKSLGPSKKPAVQVKIGNYAYRSTVATREGQFMISLSAENRKGAGIKAGDEVEVKLELDTAPRELAMPEDFADALNQDIVAKAFFESLSYSNKQRFVLPIESAKKAETRQNRINKTMSMLREGNVQ
ncbi:YdeI/OmpD-associated family protein [Planococcus sp. YIM B11945]|uniref:YdeI/OmpD-associated family protein n=1 Tax=Planococcus sp. YIM B11945 TaxID=3435410 RepID=UPI003D7C4BBF